MLKFIFIILLGLLFWSLSLGSLKFILILSTIKALFIGFYFMELGKSSRIWLLAFSAILVLTGGVLSILSV